MTVEEVDYWVTFSQHTSVTSDLMISYLEPQLQFEAQELAETTGAGKDLYEVS